MSAGAEVTINEGMGGEEIVGSVDVSSQLDIQIWLCRCPMPGSSWR